MPEVWRLARIYSDDDAVLLGIGSTNAKAWTAPVAVNDWQKTVSNVVDAIGSSQHVKDFDGERALRASRLRFDFNATRARCISES